MKIAESSLGLASQHALRQEQSREESLRFWIGNERPDFAEGEGDAVLVRLSPQALALQKEPPPQVASAKEVEDAVEAAEDPKLTTIRVILEMLTGREIRVASVTPAAPEEMEIPAEPPAAGGAESGAGQRQGWGLEYDLVERLREEETMHFAAAGQVRTEDGRTFSFQLELLMERRFVQETQIHLRAGDAKLVDPLVINLGGQGVALSELRFDFDLDGDGREETLFQLGQGSGFLALDRNRDGRITSGQELFGPASGNGFTELAGLDSDNNGWLDENDPGYTDLRIWMKDGEGRDLLFTLGEKNVGAIFLRPVATPFSLTDAGNSLQARVRESSIFLAENGGVGTVQEIDLAV